MAPPVRRRSRPVSAENQQAINDEVFRTMSVVGIGRKYHHARMHEFHQGEELKDRLTTAWPDVVTNGAGITIVGADGPAGDLQMMLARSAHLAGMSVRVFSLVELAHLLQRRATDDAVSGPAELDGVQALFIRKFSTPGKCPLMEYQAAMVEELIDKFLSDNRSVFPWNIFTENPWWSGHILKLLEARNKPSFKVTPPPKVST